MQQDRRQANQRKAPACGMADHQNSHTPMDRPRARRRIAGTSRREGTHPPPNRAFVVSAHHGRSRRPGLDRSEATLLLWLTGPFDPSGHGSWVGFGLRPRVMIRSSRGTRPATARLQVLRSLLNNGLVEEAPTPIDDPSYLWRNSEDGARPMLRATEQALRRLMTHCSASISVRGAGPPPRPCVPPLVPEAAR